MSSASTYNWGKYCTNSQVLPEPLTGTQEQEEIVQSALLENAISLHSFLLFIWEESSDKPINLSFLLLKYFSTQSLSALSHST